MKRSFLKKLTSVTLVAIMVLSMIPAVIFSVGAEAAPAFETIEFGSYGNTNKKKEDGGWWNTPFAISETSALLKGAVYASVGTVSDWKGAFDGASGTKVESATAGAWIGMDAGESKSLYLTDVILRSGGSNTEGNQIQGSSDGIAWETIDTVPAIAETDSRSATSDGNFSVPGAYGAYVWTHIAVNAQNAYRYFRVIGETQGISFQEVEFYTSAEKLEDPEKSPFVTITFASSYGNTTATYWTNNGCAPFPLYASSTLLKGAVCASDGDKDGWNGAFDGSSGTKFESNKENAWIGMDAGEATRLTDVVFRIGSEEISPEGAVIEGANSMDFSDAVEIAVVPNASNTDTRYNAQEMGPYENYLSFRWTHLPVKAEADYRYFRIRGANGISLQEIEFYTKNYKVADFAAAYGSVMAGVYGTTHFGMNTGDKILLKGNPIGMKKGEAPTAEHLMYAFDGNSGTQYNGEWVGSTVESGAGKSWVGMDAGRLVILNAVVIRHGDRFQENAKIQGSFDGENWHDIYTIPTEANANSNGAITKDYNGANKNAYTAGNWSLFPAQSDTPYRYFRLLGVEGRVHIEEIEFYVAPDPVPEMTGFSLNLNKAISVKVNYDIPDVWLQNNHGAKFIFNDGEKDVSSVPARSGENVITSVGITPAHIGGELTCRLEDGNGNVILAATDVSVKTYMEKVKASTYAEMGISEAKYDALIALVDAIAVYGEVAAGQSATVSGNFDAVSVNTQTGDVFTGVGGKLGEYATLVLNMNTASLAEDAKITVTMEGKDAQTVENIHGNNSISIKNIFPLNFNDEINITIANAAGTETYATATVTFNGYLKALAEADVSCKDLALATYQYGLAVEAYEVAK